MTKPTPKYTDIWEHIKLKGKCKVAAHPALHARIVHAVINKKYYDEAYKLQLIESRRKCKLLYSKATSSITFTLVYYDDLNNLSIGDI